MKDIEVRRIELEPNEKAPVVGDIIEVGLIHSLDTGIATALTAKIIAIIDTEYNFPPKNNALIVVTQLCNSKHRLSDLIRDLEDRGAISDYYLHHNWGHGSLELNIEFNNKTADELLYKADIRTSGSCAFWE